MNSWDAHIEKLNKISYALLERAEENLINSKNLTSIDDVIKTLDTVRKCIDTVYKLRLAQKDISFDDLGNEDEDTIELEFEPVNGAIIDDVEDEEDDE